MRFVAAVLACLLSLRMGAVAQTRTQTNVSSGGGPLTPGPVDSRVAPRNGPTMSGGPLSGVKNSIPDSQRPELRGSQNSRSGDVAEIGGGGAVNEIELKDSPASLPQTMISPDRTAPSSRGSNISQSMFKDVPESGEGRREGAAHVLDDAGKQIHSVNKAGGGEIEMHRSLKQVFDASRKGPSGFLENVFGGFNSAQSKVSRTVGIANISSPHSAPQLYRSAIETARETFSEPLAKEVTRSILGSARKKAETALPTLAREAYRAAESAETAVLEKSLKSFDSWESLLGSPRRPLVENMRHLRSDMQRVLRSAAGGSMPVSSPMPGKSDAESAQERLGPPLPTGRALGAIRAEPAAPIWFKPNESGSLTAVLPPSAVASLPGSLPQHFALNQSAAPLTGEEEIISEFRREATAFNGARLLFGYYKRSGAPFWRSASAAAIYWTRHVGESLRQTLRVARAPRLTLESSAWVKGYSEAAGEFASEEAMTLVQARSALRKALGLAADFEKITGDDSPLRAIASLSRRIETSAARLVLEDSENLPSELAILLGSAQEYSVRSWIERMREDLSSRGMSFRGGNGGPQWRASVPSELYSEQIEKILGDMKNSAPGARRMAAGVASLETSAARYTTIGRTEDYSVETVTTVRPDDRRLMFTVLRDRQSGHLAYARAEWILPSGLLRQASLMEASLP